MHSHELEFLLTQYLDGSLPPAQRAEVRKIIESNPATRAELNAYQKLDNLFLSEAPVPNIQWDKFAKRISITISAAFDDTMPTDLFWHE